MSTSPSSVGPESAIALRAAAAAQVFVDDPRRPVVRSDDCRHLLRVLRLESGELVIACDGRGHWVACQFRRPTARRRSQGPDEASSEGEGLLAPEGPVTFDPAPSPHLTVAFAPAKGDRAEWVVQKLTEIGIDRIVPLVTDRSVVRWEGERRDRAVSRLQRIAVEASAQCRRTWIPEVTEPRALADVLASEGAERAAVGQAELGGELGGDGTGSGLRCILVGPEGGWSPPELELGFQKVGLGPNVLRSETAAVVAGAMLVAFRAGTVVARSPEVPASGRHAGGQAR